MVSAAKNQGDKKVARKLELVTAKRDCLSKIEPALLQQAEATISRQGNWIGRFIGDVQWVARIVQQWLVKLGLTPAEVIHLDSQNDLLAPAPHDHEWLPK